MLLPSRRPRLMLYKAFAPLALLWLTLPAHAGHWSDPTYDVVGISDLFENGNLMLEDDWGGDFPPIYHELISFGLGPDQSMEQHGTVAATIIWVHDDPDHPEKDPPPLHQYIKETSAASWDGLRNGWGSGTVTGSVSNGLGDPATPPQTSEWFGNSYTESVSTGIHLRKVDTSSGEINTSCTFDGSVSLTSPIGDWDVQYWPWYELAIDNRVATIHSIVEQSYYKNYMDKLPWLFEEDDDTKYGDAAAAWDSIDNQWAGREFYYVTPSGFNNPTYSWTPGGSTLNPDVSTNEDSALFLFGFGAASSGSLSSTSTTCNISDSDGTTATKTYNIQWHLPYEANGGPYDIEAGKYNIGGPRGGPCGDGGILLVSDTPAHEDKWSAKIDDAEVIAGAFGQEELAGSLKVVGAIAGLSEWKTDVDDEPATQSGGESGPGTWSDAQSEMNEIYGGGNIVPASLASTSNGWQLCYMYRYQVAHYTDKYWHAFGYDAHGYDGNPNHVIYARKIDNVYDEWVFVQYKNPDGTTYTGN